MLNCCQSTCQAQIFLYINIYTSCMLRSCTSSHLDTSYILVATYDTTHLYQIVDTIRYSLRHRFVCSYHQSVDSLHGWCSFLGDNLQAQCSVSGSAMDVALISMRSAPFRSHWSFMLSDISMDQSVFSETNGICFSKMIIGSSSIANMFINTWALKFAGMFTYSLATNVWNSSKTYIILRRNTYEILFKSVNCFIRDATCT